MNTKDTNLKSLVIVGDVVRTEPAKRLTGCQRKLIA